MKFKHNLILQFSNYYNGILMKFVKKKVEKDVGDDDDDDQQWSH